MKENDNIQSESPDVDSSTLIYKERFKGDVGNWFLNVQGNAILKFLKQSNSKSILYVGGGHAQNIDELINAGFNITIQGSHESCKILLEKYIEKDKIKFIVSDLCQLPFENNHFDTVIAIRMLTHLSNWKGFIKEIIRVSNNSIIVDYPSVRSVNIFSEILFIFKKAIEKTTRKYKIFYDKDILNEFRINNCILVDKKPQFFMPMVFHRFLKIVKLSQFIEKIMNILFLTKFFGSPVIASFKKVKCE